MNNKLQGKDLITIGIYTALYIVAIFVASVANVTPLTFMFYPAISSCWEQYSSLCWQRRYRNLGLLSFGA